MNEAASPGRLVAFEGIDAAGKTTLVAAVAAELDVRGTSAVVVRQPSSSTAGSAFRAAFESGTRLAALSEFGLLMADRALVVESEVMPALARGAVVLADRYWYSHVYQAVEGLSFDEMLASNQAAFPAPAVNYWLDVDVETAAMRAESRADSRGLERANEIRSMYRDLSAKGYLRRLDATEPVETLVRTVMSELQVQTRGSGSCD